LEQKGRLASRTGNAGWKEARKAAQGMSKFLYNVHPGAAMVQKWIAELKEKTGRSLEEWEVKNQGIREPEKRKKGILRRVLREHRVHGRREKQLVVFAD
jgi:hypothetical protein